MAIVVAGYGISQFNLDNPQAVISFLPAEVWLTTFLVMVIPFGLAVALGEGPAEIRAGGMIAVGLMTVSLIATQSRAGLVALDWGAVGDRLVHTFSVSQDGRCACDGLCDDCCPDSVQCEIDPYRGRGD